MARNTTAQAESTQAEVEATESDETETPEVEETPIDLTEFNASVEAALANADEATGTVPEADVAKVRDVYQGLDGIKPKNAAKSALADMLRAFLKELDGPKAQAVMELTEKAAVAGKSGSAPRKEADPAEAFVQNVAQLTLALYLAQRNVPEGVDGEASVKAGTEQANELFPTALEVAQSEDGETDNALIRSAIKLSQSKVRKSGGTRAPFTGERRDLGAHIEAAFASVESGTFLTVAEVRAFKSEQYGDERPSAGAITNRFEPKSGKATTIPGITVGKNADGKLGATKN